MLSRRLRLLARVLTAAAVAAAAMVLAGGTASAQCSVVMTFTFDAQAGGVVLSPDRLTVNAGACVTLQNQTVTTAEFTVGGSFRRSVPAFQTTPYAATAAGTTQPVTASGATGSAKGSIVIRPRPAPSRSASASSSPRPSRSPSGRPPRRSASSSGSPSPSASPPRTVSPTAAASPAGPGAVPTPSLTGPPSPVPSTSTSSVPAVVAGPLEPPTDRGVGLPAAVAALGVVATAAALLRVLLAEPIGNAAVDDRDSLGATV